MLSLGPVQEFIATARRTRDLYAGSRLLSEAAAAAAAYLAGEVGYENLIFPAPSSAADLQMLQEAGIPNVILVLVPEAKDPRALGEGALEAARSYLKDQAEKVLGRYESHLDLQVALEQVEDLLEGYWAHMPLEGAYRQTREKVAALLAARKNTRDFAPVSWGSAAFKSSLDGARESVLRLPQDPEQANRLRVRLGLRPGEYLSGPDLLKRWWPANQGFVSTTHMAAMPFWEGVKGWGREGVVQAALQEPAALVGKEAQANTGHPVHRDTLFSPYDVRLLCPPGRARLGPKRFQPWPGLGQPGPGPCLGPEEGRLPLVGLLEAGQLLRQVLQPELLAEQARLQEGVGISARGLLLPQVFQVPEKLLPGPLQRPPPPGKAGLEDQGLAPHRLPQGQQLGLEGLRVTLTPHGHHPTGMIGEPGRGTGGL